MSILGCGHQKVSVEMLKIIISLVLKLIMYFYLFLAGICMFPNPGVTTVLGQDLQIRTNGFTEGDKMSGDGVSVLKWSCNVILTSTFI